LSASLHSAELPDVVYRLGRAPDAWEWPDWSFVSPDGTFGNRYDDPEGQYRVLYASTERETTFRECLARYRPDPAIAAAQISTAGDEDAPVTLPAGVVPAAWLARRRMGTAELVRTFCDIGHADSLAHLRKQLAPRLVHYRFDDLDAGDIRARAPRRFTQEISRYVFERTTAGDGAAFAGIRYGSRLGDNLTNWAIFEPNEPHVIESGNEIDPEDPDLRATLEAYGLVLQGE
jgi:uncharacterized protein (TIGR03382 family)